MHAGEKARHGVLPGMIRHTGIVVKSQLGFTLPFAAVAVVKFACSFMSAVLIPVTPPGILCAPTPLIPGLDSESKKLLLSVTVLVPSNAPVVSGALGALTTPVA